MALKNKFLHFKTKASYAAELAKHTEDADRKQFQAYTAFVDEGPTIYCWGKEYKCELSKEEVEKIIEDKQDELEIDLVLIDDVVGEATLTPFGTSVHTKINRVPANKIDGTIPLKNLPQGALERLVIVENQAARFRLTSSEIQEGDTVKQKDTGVLYFVVDEKNLNNANGYVEYTAGTATSVPWSGVTDKPTDLVQKDDIVYWKNEASQSPMTFGYTYNSDLKTSYFTINKAWMVSQSNNTPMFFTNLYGELNKTLGDKAFIIPPDTISINKGDQNVTLYPDNISFKCIIPAVTTPTYLVTIGDMNSELKLNYGDNQAFIFCLNYQANFQESNVVYVYTGASDLNSPPDSGSVALTGYLTRDDVEYDSDTITGSMIISSEDGIFTYARKIWIYWDSDSITLKPKDFSINKNNYTNTIFPDSLAVTCTIDGVSDLVYVNTRDGGDPALVYWYEESSNMMRPQTITVTLNYVASFEGSNITYNYVGFTNSQPTNVCIPWSEYSNLSGGSSMTSVGYNDSFIVVDPNTYYYWNSSANARDALYINVNVSKFNEEKSAAMVLVYGARQVNISINTSIASLSTQADPLDLIDPGMKLSTLLKQADILTTGSSSSSYRIYAFNYVAPGTVAVNCSEYNE